MRRSSGVRPRSPQSNYVVATALPVSGEEDGISLATASRFAVLNPSLPLRAVFCLLRYVAPAEDVSSVTASGGDADHGRAIFTTTHWSIVLEAQGESPAAQQALESLCRTYWRPIYGFVRRQGARPEEAEDLTQGFFALILERKDLNSVRQEKGRLRSYLLSSLKNFLVDESRHAMAAKRGKGQRLIPLDEILNQSDALGGC